MKTPNGDRINVDLNPFVIRQGDVNLMRIDALPPGLDQIELPLSEGRIVLQHGEATGHAHAFYGIADGNVRVFRSKAAPKGSRPSYLQVVRTVARLKHEEHTEAKIPPGIYRLPTQVEHSDDDEPRVVED